MEIWKTLQSNPNYEVSSYGRVRSITHKQLCKDGHTRTYQGKVLTPKLNTYGYLFVALGRSMDNTLIHRLVATEFIPNPSNCKCINHKDGNKSNNSVDNLEWCTHSENLVHAYKTGLNPIPKRVKQLTLNGELVREWESASQCEAECGFNHRKISRCCNHKAKTHAGYRWVFS